MKRFLVFAFALAVSLLTADCAQAQHAAGAQESAHGSAAGEAGGHGGADLTIWKWANFAILAGALGYMIAKKAGGFFSGRTAEIRKGIDEAAKLKQEAEEKLAEIDRRMAGLAADIENLRAEARSELAAESERAKAETGRAVAKVQAMTEQEIASSAKAARQELKAYAAELALDLAVQKIRSRMTPELQDGLLDSFVECLPREGDARRDPEREVH